MPVVMPAWASPADLVRVFEWLYKDAADRWRVAIAAVPTEITERKAAWSAMGEQGCETAYQEVCRAHYVVIKTGQHTSAAPVKRKRLLRDEGPALKAIHHADLTWPQAAGALARERGARV